MKKQISPIIAMIIVVGVVGILVALWVKQPFQPKIHGLEPPTVEQRRQQAEEMKQGMIESMKAKKNHSAVE